jgi:SET domain-containing protein
MEPELTMTKHWKPTTPYFTIRKSGIQGKGAFAVRSIRKGARIAEYIGERISHEEAENRYDEDAMDHPYTYLFTVDDEIVIDATRRGNGAKYINHSCDPNCESVIVGDRVFIEARRGIKIGEEITYDYNLYCDGPYGRGWRTRYACHCQARTCRGTLLRPPKRKKRKITAKSKKR